jgi:hypothetical protein
MDTNAIQEAFIRGFEAGTRYRREPEEESVPQYSLVRGGDSGVGMVTADKSLYKDRVVSAATTGTLASLVTAIVSGLLGLGVGSAVGMPVQGALAGTALGGSLGYLGGSAKGQLDADHRFLAEKGYSAKYPVPVKELMLRPGISAALPLASFARIKKIPKIDQ